MSFKHLPSKSGNGVFYAFLALVAWLPLPLGSKYPWTISIAEIWCYLIVGIILVQITMYQRPLPHTFNTARIALALLVLNLIWLLVQCMPMPLSWLQSISPAAAELYRQSSVAQAPVSLDASVTFYQFQTATYLLVFFCLALYLIDSKQKLTWLIYTILASELFQAIYGAMMILTGAEYSFFISKAALHSHIGSATGTFTNRDHLAGYLEMSLSLGVGYMLTMLSDKAKARHWRSRIRQWSELLLGSKARLRIVLILLCLGLVLTHSRGGNIGFFSGLGIAGFLFLIFAKKKPRATVVFLTSLIVLDIVLIGSWVGLSKIMQRLEHTSTITESRDDAYIATIPMINDYILTGVGSGNYFNTFPAYKTPALPGYWNHAHNDYLEFMSEQGVLGTALLAGVVLCSLGMSIQVLRKRRSPFVLGISFASLMGVASILVHSGVDFNLQILANSSMFMLILAMPFICRNLQTKE